MQISTEQDSHVEIEAITTMRFREKSTERRTIMWHYADRVEIESRDIGPWRGHSYNT
jgi:hypothetical protein